MRYELEYDPTDTNALAIHVNQEIITTPGFMVCVSDVPNMVKERMEGEASNPKRLFAFFEHLCGIPGIAYHFEFQRYVVGITKAPLFPWENIIPELHLALKYFLADDLEAVRGIRGTRVRRIEGSPARKIYPKKG